MNVHLHKFPPNAKWGNNGGEHSCISLSWISQGLSKSLEFLVPHLHVWAPSSLSRGFPGVSCRKPLGRCLLLAGGVCWRCPRAEGSSVELGANIPLLSLQCPAQWTAPSWAWPRRGSVRASSARAQSWWSGNKASTWSSATWTFIFPTAPRAPSTSRLISWWTAGWTGRRCPRSVPQKRAKTRLLRPWSRCTWHTWTRRTKYQ